jgi:hypothetical protein
MSAPNHLWNWYVGWGLLLAAFATGAGLGLCFHDEHFWGGYASFRRRLVRLGHIALAALGMVNLLFALSPWPGYSQWQTTPASIGWILGALSMPASCFLTAWKDRFRPLFVVPVSLLILAAILTLWGANP